MIDIHNHILFGVDDGSQTLEDSLAMLRIAENDGIHQILCTSHCLPGFMFENDLLSLANVFNELNERKNQENIKVDLYLGCELMLTPDSLQWVKDAKVATINQTHYILIEVPWHPDMLFDIDEDQMLQGIMDAGYQIVIAHPERYPSVLQDFSRLETWRKMGCLFQVNSSSLMETQKMDIYNLAWKLVEHDYCDFVGTDAHKPTGKRIPQLSYVYQAIEAKRGKDIAKKIFIDNPLLLLKGEKIA